jgi:DNA (cytosine-5)-methyltransferase 1
MEKLKLLDLFSGIGGFSLGLERSGAFETVAFCEIEPFCRKVLKKHWPEVPQYGDIRGLSASQLELDGIRVDAICGGFPCQDISTAGKGAGLAGERSGLWFEFARLIGEIRPRYVIVENVSALLVRGLDAVLGSLAEIGYDAEWHCIPAWFVGAPHGRDRVWIVAYPRSVEYEGDGDAIEREATERFYQADNVARPNKLRRMGARLGSYRNTGKAQSWAGNGGSYVANAKHNRVSVGRRAKNAGGKTGQLRRIQGDDQSGGGEQEAAIPANASPVHEQGQFASILDEKIREVARERSTGSCGYGDGQWAVEPAVGRVAHGVPNRVDRLKGLGNAVVPQIPELIGRAILEYELSLKPA